jgi:hypothetical protein
MDAISRFLGIIGGSMRIRYTRKSGDRPVIAQKKRLLRFLGQALHHPSGETGNVPPVALYPQHSCGCGQLAGHGGILPGDKRQGAGSKDP